MSLNPLTNSETQKRRMDICQVCPHRRENIPGYEKKFREEHAKKKVTAVGIVSAWNIEKMICDKCGCYMPAKTRLTWVTCPVKKW